MIVNLLAMLARDRTLCCASVAARFLLFFMGRASLRPSFLSFSQYVRLVFFLPNCRRGNRPTCLDAEIYEPWARLWSAFDLRCGCSSFTQSLVIYRGFRLQCKWRAEELRRGVSRCWVEVRDYKLSKIACFGDFLVSL